MQRTPFISPLKYRFFRQGIKTKRIILKFMKRYSGYTMGGKEVLICDLEKQCKFYIRSFY